MRFRTMRRPILRITLDFDPSRSCVQTMAIKLAFDLLSFDKIISNSMKYLQIQIFELIKKPEHFETKKKSKKSVK